MDSLSASQLHRQDCVVNRALPRNRKQLPVCATYVDKNTVIKNRARPISRTDRVDNSLYVTGRTHNLVATAT